MNTLHLDPQLMRNACRVHGVSVLAGDDAQTMMRKLLYMESTSLLEPIVVVDEVKWRADQVKNMTARGLRVTEQELDRRWAVIRERKIHVNDMKLDRAVYDSMSDIEKAKLMVVLETKEGQLYVRGSEAPPLPPTPLSVDAAPNLDETTAETRPKTPAHDKSAEQLLSPDQSLSPEQQLRRCVAAAAEQRALSMSANASPEDESVAKNPDESLGTLEGSPAGAAADGSPAGAAADGSPAGAAAEGSPAEAAAEIKDQAMVDDSTE